MTSSAILWRLNNLATWAVYGLLLLTFLCSMEGYVHHMNPKVSGRVRNVDFFSRNHRGLEEVSFTVRLDADLSSVMSWSTKQLFVFLSVEYRDEQDYLHQVVLWDRIVQSRDETIIDEPAIRNKYRFVDAHQVGLRGHSMNLTLSWNIMPHVGRLTQEKIVLQDFLMPTEYVDVTQRSGSSTEGNRVGDKKVQSGRQKQEGSPKHQEQFVARTRGGADVDATIEFDEL